MRSIISHPMVGVGVHCSNLSPSNAQNENPGRVPALSTAKFVQIPSSVSLMCNSPTSTKTNHSVSQSQGGRIENLHLVSLAKQFKLDEAYEFLIEMESSDVSITSYSYSSLLEACGKANSLRHGKLFHDRIRNSVKDPWSSSYNSVLRMYCECGSLADAQDLFEKMPMRDDFSWAIIISAYAREGQIISAFGMFSQFLQQGMRPNASVYKSLLQGLLDPSHLEGGKQLHSHIIRSGLLTDCTILTATVNMYFKCGCTDHAKLVFDHMSKRDAVAWTALMVCYTQSDKEKDVLQLFWEMVGEDALLDDFVFSVVLKACSALQDLDMGRQIHALIIKLGLEVLVYVGTPLVDFYVKCGSIESARRAFDEILEPNEVSWSALITGYSQSGGYHEAIDNFLIARNNRMLNSHIYTSIFQACSGLAHQKMSGRVHADALKRGLISYPCGKSALITMYSKCGRLDYAFRAFESIDEPDAVAWTAIISGCAYHGNALEALNLFIRMQESAVRPNGVTFIAVFTACSHAGLITEAKEIFDNMRSEYGVEPTIDHYNCIIDLYSRAEKLQEAFEFVKTMPFEPDAMSWKSLLGGCLIHKDFELGKIAAEKVFQLDPEDTASYIFMFNLYTSEGKCEEAANIRKLMAERNLRKEVGCSWISVNGEVHQFVASDRHHPQATEIYLKLKEINFKDEDRQRDLLTEDDLACDFPEQEEKLVHSEKLAIAFGLISAPSSVPLVIFKNIRACKHCHEFTKYVSRVANRDIIVRDANRFHHFVQGKCSCHDYW